MLDSKGKLIETIDFGAGNLSRNDVVIKQGGVHTLRAVVTDEVDEVSTNTCSAQVDVKGGFPFFVGGYFGKERLTHDDAGEVADALGTAAVAAGATEFSRCSPLAGLAIGIQPMISDKAQFEAALGVKFAVRQPERTRRCFGDAAVNRVLSNGFFGGGVSWWDIGKDTSSVGLLLQGGFDLDKDGKWQIVGQTRLPFFNQLRQHREQLPVLGRHPLQAEQLEVVAR